MSQPVALQSRRAVQGMSSLGGLGGVVRYEFTMQIRRVAFWIVFALVGALALVQFTNPNNYTHDANLAVSRYSVVVVEAAGVAGFFALGVGLLLADRFRRDRTTRTDEVLRTMPAATLVRLLGKYLGNVLAALVPIALIYVVGFASLVARWRDFTIVPLALAGFAAFVVPAVLFVAAFSIACTTALWPPLFQFLFIGYWLWDSLDPKGPIPTLDGTVLSPSGRLVMTGIFGFTPFRTSDASYYPHASAALGVANIAALLGAGSVALFAAWWWLTWQARHA
jgi:ABC-2 type transport system permease protein